MLVPQPRILFIDAYDSFSNNIISLLETTLSCSVRTIKIDDPILLSSPSALHEELSHYAAVVCGPGPGNPANERDIGIIKRIWKLGDDDLLPVLGVCLGFQSLCLEFGANVGRLNGPQHGIIRKVSHVGEKELLGKNSIFEGVGELKATHYQSLCVDIGQDSVQSFMWNEFKWGQPAGCPDLIPLAYAESDLSVSNNSGIKDGRVLVAVQHASKPFWALQYHPESICTDEESHKVIINWFKHAQMWNRANRYEKINSGIPKHGLMTVHESLLSRSHNSSAKWGGFNAELSGKSGDLICATHTMDFPSHVPVADLVEVIQHYTDKRILFESTNAHEPFSGTSDVRGRYSIIALRLDSCPIFEYRVGNDFVNVLVAGKKEEVELMGGGIWSFFAKYLEIRKVAEGNPDSPFWGGFMGYTTYELGLESIGVQSSKPQKASRPDVCFAWVDHSLVIDHVKGKLFFQSLISKGSPGTQGVNETWRDVLIKNLEAFLRSKQPSSPSGSLDSEVETNPSNTPNTTPSLSTSSSSANLNQIHQQAKPTSQPVVSVVKPTNASYESKVTVCQEHISNGDSYELCLTDQTIITLPKPTSSFASWDLYRTLRARQPAPFASFIKLGGATLVSSSPERFLTWDENNHCSLRPMKGTVRKTAAVDTLAKAKELLDVPKEKAENLMIVDLVRHDLHSICGSGNVQVPRLCVVEEYKSVFQMISVVEGQIPTPEAGMEETRHTGLDVLAASLPPGSMTGAPKKRSCEILQTVEEQERGLYSGVVGYLDVRGRGDWSVTIRTMFNWDDEDEMIEVDSVGEAGEKTKSVATEKWHIGAGGAVTTLSTAVGEREEMLTKLNGTLGIFLR